MHPRTREVRKPDSGIDPRGSGTGQPPLLQGFLKHRKAAPAAQASAPGSTEAGATAQAAGAKPATPKPSSAPKARTAAAKAKAKTQTDP